MIKSIDGYHIAAEVRLLRQLHKGAILIVEGGDDAKAFDRFVDPAYCKTQVAFGKKNVIDALNYLEDEGFQGVVAVVDADFDRILGIDYPLECLCVTDSHDLDLTIFNSPALGNYVREHADEALFAQNFKSDLEEVRKAVLAASEPIACCRLASQKGNLRLDFKDLKLENYINADDLTVNTDSLLQKIIDQSKSPPTLAALKALLKKEEDQKHDPRQLNCGHDASEILGIALRRMLARRRDVHTWASEIESGLRLSFDSDAFSGTQVYTYLRAWEEKSGKYAIF